MAQSQGNFQYPQYNQDFQPSQHYSQQQPQKNNNNIIPARVLSNYDPRDGSAQFAFQTMDGQQRAESVQADGSVRGSYSYTDPDGRKLTVNYVADKNGFHAYGDHLPTPPPIPAAHKQAMAMHHQAAQQHAALSQQQGGSAGHHGGRSYGGEEDEYDDGQYRPQQHGIPNHHSSFAGPSSNDYQGEGEFSFPTSPKFAHGSGSSSAYGGHGHGSSFGQFPRTPYGGGFQSRSSQVQPEAQERQFYSNQQQKHQQVPFTGFQRSPGQTSQSQF